MKKLFGLIAAILVLLFNSKVGAMDNSCRQPILIQGAMNSEINLMIEALNNPQEETINGWTFWQGTIQGYPVIVSRTLKGMTNAAVATTLGLERFHPKLIISQGTSGGHDPALYRFDIVLGEKIINYSTFKTKHRDMGQGIELADWELAPVELRLAEKYENFDYFISDSALIDIAKNVSYSHGLVTVGVISTSNQWNREIDFIKMLHERYGTSVEEMESASVAQVAKAYNIPILAIRVLSDSELNNQGFERIAGQYCQEYTVDVIKAIIDSGII